MRSVLKISSKASMELVAADATTHTPTTPVDSGLALGVRSRIFLDGAL